MQKKVISILIMISLTICLTFASLIDVHASESEMKRVDGSYLTADGYSEGTTSSGISTRGKHLMDGTSSITKSGVGKVYAYGSTTAGHVVDFLSVVVYVEKYNATYDSWDQVDVWQENRTNDYYISTSKIVYVDRGYYYRVRSEHVCGNNNETYDEALSVTDGIFIP